MQESLFAQELNRALELSGLTCEAVVAKLQRGGFFVSPDTFNEWRQGQSLPRTPLSFSSVLDLENILDVPRGQLCDNLLHDLFPEGTFLADEHLSPDLVTVPSGGDADDVDDFDGSFGTTDWSIDAHRLAMKDEIRVSSDYKTVVWNTIICSLVPPVPNPSLDVGVTLAPDETPYLGKYIVDTRGASLENAHCLEKNGIRSYTANLVLSGSHLFPGELAFCSYVRGSVCQTEHTRLAWRLFRKELDFYSCTVFFEGQAPRSAQYVIDSHDAGQNGPIAIEPLEVRDNFVKIAITDFGQKGDWGYISYEL